MSVELEGEGITFESLLSVWLGGGDDVVKD